jgi:hypothetical protein
MGKNKNDREAAGLLAQPAQELAKPVNTVRGDNHPRETEQPSEQPATAQPDEHLIDPTTGEYLQGKAEQRDDD